MLHAAALGYFREVARAGSIRKAAGVLNVAASALNRQILNLEAQLGSPLFDRLPGGMRLTVAGNSCCAMSRTRFTISSACAAPSTTCAPRARAMCR